MSAPADIITLLVTLLETDWTSANTSSVTPVFTTGWFDGQAGPNQVVVAGTPDESARGTSGIAGIEPGGGNVQQIQGITFVESIAEQRTDSVVNPKLLSYQFMREVQRIIMANVNSVAGYDYVSFLGTNRRPPSEAERPFTAGYSSRIGYGFRFVS